MIALIILLNLMCHLSDVVERSALIRVEDKCEVEFSCLSAGITHRSQAIELISYSTIHNFPDYIYHHTPLGRSFSFSDNPSSLFFRSVISERFNWNARKCY